MRTRTFVLAAMLALLAASAVAQADGEAAADNADAAGADDIVLVARLRELIEQTDDPGVAITAYARACAIDPASAGLHAGYMWRMLAAGLPQVARIPAARLVALGRPTAAAWGVLGYHHGREGRLDEALAATVRSAELDPQDASVMHNLGQLLAWYDGAARPPALPAVVLRALQQQRAAWQRRPAFQAAYQRVEHAANRLQRLREELADKIDDAARREQAALEQALALAEQARLVRADLEAAEDRLDWLRREYDDANVHVGTPDQVIVVIGTDGSRTFVRRGRVRTVHGPVLHRRILYTRYPDRYRKDLDREIDRVENRRDELDAQYDRLRREARAAVRRLRRRRAAREALEDRVADLPARPDARLRWDPPAVGGAVVPRQEHIPRPMALPLPADPAREAAEKLQLVRAYLANGLPEKGQALARALVKQYPTTPAAGEAQALLAAQARANE